MALTLCENVAASAGRRRASSLDCTDLTRHEQLLS
jgi:hypothetical protein